MAKYSYITDKTHNNRKIQVESAKRDGSGKNFENNYAKQNGNYQSFTAGLSNNFDTKLTEKDESAYNFRPTATIGSVELEVGSPCKVKKIVGGSVAFNQIVQSVNIYETQGITSSYSNGKLTISGTIGESGVKYIGVGNLVVTSGHKYYLAGFYIENHTISFQLGVSPWSSIFKQSNKEDIVSAGDSGIIIGYWTVASGETIDYTSYPQLIDLTQMFGSTIADYIYSLEQANAGSGVAWFKRYFPKDYYAYNSGELVSVKTQGKKITHFNQWDEEVIINSGHLETKNYQKCLPNTIYHIAGPIVSPQLFGNGFEFYDIDKNLVQRVYPNSGSNITSPSNAVYFKFGIATSYGTTYNHDICINFHYDGERDGEYEPYNSKTYSCDDVELRGIPQLDENNNLIFNGDEYLADGTKNVRYASYTFTGEETWGKSSVADNNSFYCNLADIPQPNSEVAGQYSTYIPKLISSSDFNVVASATLVYSNSKDTITICKRSNNVGAQFRYGAGLDSAITEDQVRQLFIGKTIVYEVETTTTDSLTPFTEVQECDNWGTEEWLAPTTDTRPCEVPVGHETDYLPDLKAKLEVAPTTPNENGVYVMEHNASGNIYTPIATWLSDNGYAKADTLPTKDSVGGTLRQLLAVKETIDFDNTAYVDLGSLSWTYLGNNAFSATNVGVKSVANDSVLKALSTKYKVVSYNTLNGDATKVCMCGYVGDDSRIYVRDTSYTDATAFKNAMKGVLLAYEKASQ